MLFSGRPSADTPVPAVVRGLAAGAAIHPVWINEAGGLTYRLEAATPGAGTRYVKWLPPGAATTGDLAAEAARLRWAAPYVTVPPVLDQGSDDSGSWLLTRTIPGEYAVADRWKQDPATAVRAIGEGLRAFHDALPVAGCPFDWSPGTRLATAADQVKAAELRASAPPVDRAVVCHGDSCAPNTLIGADGRWSGHVDLGRLGVADRWADLAVATLSTTWNYGPGWEKPLLDAYGVDEDPERTAYYRAVWDLE